MEGSGEPTGVPTPTPSPSNGQAEIALPLSQGAVKEAQYALLTNLKSLLESAHDNVWRMQDEGLDAFPVNVDTRPLFDWIADNVEALDALGWRDIMDAENAARPAVVRALVADGEGKNRPAA